jgi:hypothetical protein
MGGSKPGQALINLLESWENLVGIPRLEPGSRCRLIVVDLRTSEVAILPGARRRSLGLKTDEIRRLPTVGPAEAW